MEEKIELNDMSDDLLVLNKNTVEHLFVLSKPCECVALYMFYYKTAKWQKTNKIKAVDSYVCKSLGWGKDKVTKIKKILKDAELIEIVQNRDNGKIDGWYIKVNYVVNNTKLEKTPVADFPVTDFATSDFQDTNAYKEYIKCLINKYNMLLCKLEGKHTDSNIEKMSTYREIIDYMNTVNEHHTFEIKQPFFYKATSKDTQRYINARLREGYDIEDFKDVIYFGYLKFVEKEFQNEQGDSSVKYFRPSTLFSDKHFGEYLNEYRSTCGK